MITEPIPTDAPGVVPRRLRQLDALILSTLLIAWIALPGLVRADAEWPDYRQPFKSAIGIPLHKSKTISVELPQQLISAATDVCLTIDIESNFYFQIDGYSQKGFEGFTPKVSVNGALLFGNYEIRTKPVPPRQTVDLRIKTKYLKPGRNTLTFDMGIDPELRYECQRGSTCIAYVVRSLQFTDSTAPVLTPDATDERQIACSFEAQRFESSAWNLIKVRNRWTGSGGFQEIRIDPNHGAGQTQACLAMTFKLGTAAAAGRKHRNVHAVILNRKKRDLSRHDGIEFSVKATRDLRVRFGLADSQPDAPQKERWTSDFSASTRWRNVRVGFDTLSVHPPRAHAPATDGKLSLDRVVTLFWVIPKQAAIGASEATLYLDEISFY